MMMGETYVVKARVLEYSNGDVYKGFVRKNVRSGSGVHYYGMERRYEGDWADGKPHGYGVEVMIASGDRYRGQFRKGLWHGFGVFTFSDGDDVYAGEWYHGMQHGCGVYTSKAFGRYIGQFKRNSFHGLGQYNCSNGDTYAGEFLANEKHGFGVCKFANGDRYEGAWRKDFRQRGISTFKIGKTLAGHWQNVDVVVEVPTYQSDTAHVSCFADNHSKVLKAVQKARRAAEKSYDVAKVDKQVNRAVAAANRAADAARDAAAKAACADADGSRHHTSLHYNSSRH